MSRHITDPSVLSLFDKFKAEQIAAPASHAVLAAVDLSAVSFVALDIFNSSALEFLGPTKIAANTEGVRALPPGRIPVYSAAAKPIAKVDSSGMQSPHKANPLNPDVSFAANGDGSAGRNFFLHAGEYYVLTDRTVLRFSTANVLQSQWVYLQIRGIRAEFGLSRDHKANPKTLRACHKLVWLPQATSAASSIELQRILVTFVEWYESNLAAVDSFATELALHASGLERALLSKLYQEQSRLGRIQDEDLQDAFDEWSMEAAPGLQLSDLSFEQARPFPLKGSKSAYFDITTPQLSVTQASLVEDVGGLPVYTGARGPVARVSASAFSAKVICASPQAPIISFASDGENAGSNWVIHQEDFFVNASRKILRLSTGFSPLYFYFALRNMKEMYSLDWGNKASTERLAQVVTLPIPEGTSLLTSFDVQELLGQFLAHRIQHYDDLRAKADDLRAKADELRVAFLTLVTGGAV